MVKKKTKVKKENLGGKSKETAREKNDWATYRL
jgi:hypothetical protein